MLPGLSNYSFDQLFYIAFGQTFCSIEEEDVHSYIYDEHTPNNLRVNIALLNSEHFAKTFNCPIYSPMNPDNKCLIW